METDGPVASRALRTEHLEADLAVVGGGMAGTCCALTAARAGLKVVLMQDRPVLGGNASSEIRLWVLGATAHMGNNNRWSREGGVIDEILVENLWRNNDGNPVVFDALLLEKVWAEPNIRLLLDTAAFEAGKENPDRIASVRAFCAQNSTLYEVRAPLFCDASGDGVLGFLSGAAFRVGAEPAAEFGEGFAPAGEFGHLLGHSLYFYSKDAGRPVPFVAPSFALKDIPGRIPRFKAFGPRTHGCQLWWIEWGGRLDTVHATQEIKQELWRVVYGVWDYIKNSGAFPEAANLTLEWVGLIPGKRESRRFEGAYMLRQQDVVARPAQPDAVAFGGWSIDLHPADGVYSPLAGSHHLHSKGIYQIPYRCYYSRNIENLFLAGRIISASHVAFGTTRVMATCAHGAQAVALAAALCRRYGVLPRDILAPERMRELQRELLRTGHHLPQHRLEDPDDLVARAELSASSELRLAELPSDGPPLRLERSWAQLLPLPAGPVPRLIFTVDVANPTTWQVQLRTARRPDEYTPEVVLATKIFALAPGGRQKIEVDFAATLDQPRYVFVCLMQNEEVTVHRTNRRVTGLVTVARIHMQRFEKDVGGEDFEFWTPERRPKGQNFAFTADPPLALFGPENLRRGVTRPTSGPNAWVAEFGAACPALEVKWPEAQTIARVELFFDTDSDHALESVQYGQPERAVPFCVRHYRLRGARGEVLAECTENHQTRNTLRFDPPLHTERLTLELLATHGPAPAALFGLRAYSR